MKGSSLVPSLLRHRLFAYQTLYHRLFAYEMYLRGVWALAGQRLAEAHTLWGLWPTNPKNRGTPPPGYVHGGVLRSSTFLLHLTHLRL